MKRNLLSAVIDASLGAAAPVRPRRPLGWIGLQPRGLGHWTAVATRNGTWRPLTPNERRLADVQRHAALDAAHSHPARTEAERKAAGLPHQGKREMTRRRVSGFAGLGADGQRLVIGNEGF